MIRLSRHTLTLLAAALIVAGGRTASHADEPADIPAHLASIRTQLISEDFTAREKGRAELGKIPPAAIEALRAAERAEPDEEVRAQLRARIIEMELYVMVHPPGITLERKEYTLSEMAALVNKQIGVDALPTSVDNRKFTVAADNLPFWEIMRQLNEQSPLTISPISTGNTNGGLNFRYRLFAEPLANNRPILVSETFGIVVPRTATATKDGWSIRTPVNCDPRLKVSQYISTMSVDQITAQSGENLLKWVVMPKGTWSSPGRPVPMFMVTTTLRPPTNPGPIREIRGSVTMRIVESERTIRLDLADEKLEPVVTSVATFTLKKDAAGNVDLMVESKKSDGTPVANSDLPDLSLRLLDKEGKVVHSSASQGFAIPITRVAVAGAVGAAPVADVKAVEVTFVEKSREYVLPVVLRDIDLPPLATPPAAGDPATRRLR